LFGALAAICALAVLVGLTTRSFVNRGAGWHVGRRGGGRSVGGAARARWADGGMPSLLGAGNPRRAPNAGGRSAHASPAARRGDPSNVADPVALSLRLGAVAGAAGVRSYGSTARAPRIAYTDACAAAAEHGCGDNRAEGAGGRRGGAPASE
jgi:hypothetical protein